MTVEVGIALAIFVALSGVFWKMYDMIQKAGEKGEKAQADLAAHKVHAAEVFATKQGMQEQTAQLLRAIEGIGNRIDSISERIDRAFERQPARRSSQP
ncbi:hypothetical protein G6N74_29525 [Mesorhizobium sp. CGMCC 1.15528]|uniref:Uncharacterized protein n=1 Tax=Mesorhizobium zhangyense TaxID=1776730 RepID=A0A7C9RCF9_9HYPH|nr:hypothetical protein [Mesorhizobium zhangyense]NGN45197.1 hypothetical protein [Mesorhizobium zhangyense]